MDSVVGIDLSGVTAATKGHTVAVEVLLTEPLTLGERLQVPRRAVGDRVLLEWIVAKHPRLVGIDAPLTLPHSITCTEAGCGRCQPGSASYLERDVDRMAREQGGGMPFVMLAAIAFRAMYLARMLKASGIEAIEVYPAAAYRVMGATGKGYHERADVLAARVGPFAWTVPDEVDAVCAALVAADWAGSNPSAIRGVDGTIWLPDRRQSLG